MPVTYSVKKSIFPQSKKARQKRGKAKGRKLPDCRVTNNVTSQGNHNTIICTGNNSTVAQKVVNIKLNIKFVIERPLQPTTRFHNKNQNLYRKLLDPLDQLSVKGELKKYNEIISKLLLHEKDPDCRATLWTAAAACCINGGKMKNAHKALRHVTDLLPQTQNSSEHELARDYYQSLIYLREGKYDQGVRVIMMALVNIQMKQVGHMRAWLLINLGWCYTKMTQLEQDRYKQAELIKDTKESFARAINDSCHQDEEEDKKTRIHQCALIGCAYLRLRCWHSESVDDTKQGIKDEIPPEDITEAGQILHSLEGREMLCGICEVLYHLAKAHLCYRFKQYPEALKEAEAARDLAIRGEFNDYIDKAKSSVKRFKQTVI